MSSWRGVITTLMLPPGGVNLKEFPIKFEQYFEEPISTEKESLPMKRGANVTVEPKGYTEIIIPKEQGGGTALVPDVEVEAYLKAGGRRA